MHSEATPQYVGDVGSVGKPGRDAKACSNFALDVRIDTELKKVVFIVLPLHHSFSSTFTAIYHNKSSKCATEYVRSNVTIDSPESNEQNEIETEFPVYRYKKFLIENMKNASLTSMAQETYRAIDENRLLNEKDTLKGLLREACELEKNYFELKKTIKMKPLYKRLFVRVKRLKINVLKEDDKRVLTHLRLNLRNKLTDLREDDGNIFNLEEYNEATIEAINLRSYRPSEITTINDTELQNSLNQLMLGVNGNYILEKYHHVIEGFRLAYFPFAVDYLESFNLPVSPSSYNDLEDIGISTTNRLKSLSQSIQYIKWNNGDIMMNLNYIDYTSPTHSLYIWKNSDVRDEIRELFSGKRVKLLADVKESPTYYNGMKYKTVDIVFRSSDQTVNDQLNTALQSFMLKLTNTGISATRCDNNFYHITTDPLEIVTSFIKDENGVPLTRIQTYDMMRNSQPALSPYTMWEVQIIEDTYEEDFRNISELASFGQYDFDIELHGTGKYVQNDVPICNNKKLAKFYSQILN